MDGTLTKLLHGNLHLLSEQNFMILVKTLRGLHPYVEGAEFTPKRPNKTQGYITGATFTSD